MAQDQDSATAAEREADFFDKLVSETEDFNPFADRGWLNLKRRFQQQLGADIKVGRILDIGCGTGQSRQLYRESTQSYVGIDLSSEAIRRARSKFAADFWEVADACALPFESNCFDVVAFSSVLHHIPDYTAALREAFRVLKPGGMAFAFDPNALHPAMALFRLPQSPLYSPKGVSPNERPLLGSALRRAFAEAGFSRIWQRGQSDLPYRRTAIRWINMLLGVYNFGDRVLERVGLGKWFGTFLITAGYKGS